VPNLPPLPSGVATGVGSMPGTDFAESLRIILGELPDVSHLPEIPGRSESASMTGRSLALLVDLAADLQSTGWRLSDAAGLDLRRARSLLAQDLDALEEHARGYAGRFKVQVAGPWTLAATVERPRADRVVADRGARRDLAQSLAEGTKGHVRDVQRRLPDAQLLVQVDEPALPVVLAGELPTASGLHRHRSVDAPAATEALGWMAEAITEVGATPVVHCCAADVPVRLLADAGFRALSVDAGLLRPDEYADYAAALDEGTGLWLGVVPATEPAAAPTDAQLTAQVQRLVDDLGHDAETFARLGVITPACGLAGADPAWAREALRLARRVARNLAGAVSVEDDRMGP